MFDVEKLKQNNELSKKIKADFDNIKTITQNKFGENPSSLKELAEVIENAKTGYQVGDYLEEPQVKVHAVDAFKKIKELGAEEVICSVQFDKSKNLYLIGPRKTIKYDENFNKISEYNITSNNSSNSSNEVYIDYETGDIYYREDTALKKINDTEDVIIKKGYKYFELIVIGKYIYVFENQKIHKIDKLGNEIWALDVIAGKSNYIDAQGNIYCHYNGEIIKVDENGEKVLTINSPLSFSRFVADSEGSIYGFGNGNNSYTLLKIDKYGREKYKISNVGQMRCIDINNDYIYVSAYSKRFKMTKDNKIIWEDGSSDTIADNGIVPMHEKVYFTNGSKLIAYANKGYTAYEIIK